MKEYRITTEGLKALQKKQLLYALPVLVLSTGLGIFIGAGGNKGQAFDFSILPYVLPLLVLVLGWSVYRGLQRQKKLLTSYTLILTPNALLREQLNTPPVCLYLNDVQTIVKGRSGGLKIRGKEKADVIYVPAQIDRLTELESTLADMCPIAVKKDPSPLPAFTSAIPFLAMGLVVCLYTTSNRLAVAVSGTLLTAILVYSLIAGQRSRNIDRRTKRRLLWVIVVLASVVYVTVEKLTGFSLP